MRPARARIPKLHRVVAGEPELCKLQHLCIPGSILPAEPRINFVGHNLHTLTATQTMPCRMNGPLQVCEYFAESTILYIFRRNHVGCCANLRERQLPAEVHYCRVLLGPPMPASSGAHQGSLVSEPTWDRFCRWSTSILNKLAHECRVRCSQDRKLRNHAAGLAT